MKEALKSIASSEHRTVSNKAFMILKEWVERNSGEEDHPDEFMP